jgi:hypothetical protein
MAKEPPSDEQGLVKPGTEIDITGDCDSLKKILEELREELRFARLAQGTYERLRTKNGIDGPDQLDEAVKKELEKLNGSDVQVAGQAGGRLEGGVPLPSRGVPGQTKGLGKIVRVKASSNPLVFEAFRRHEELHTSQPQSTTDMSAKEHGGHEVAAYAHQIAYLTEMIRKLEELVCCDLQGFEMRGPGGLEGWHPAGAHGWIPK